MCLGHNTKDTKGSEYILQTPGLDPSDLHFIDLTPGGSSPGEGQLFCFSGIFNQKHENVCGSITANRWTAYRLLWVLVWFWGGVIYFLTAGGSLHHHGGRIIHLET